jgi:copper chaperone
MGYPETGSVEGLKAAAMKARSFVSCAIGRIDNATAASKD